MCFATAAFAATENVRYSRDNLIKHSLSNSQLHYCFLFDQ